MKRRNEFSSVFFFKTSLISNSHKSVWLFSFGLNNHNPPLAKMDRLPMASQTWTGLPQQSWHILSACTRPNQEEACTASGVQMWPDSRTGRNFFFLSILAGFSLHCAFAVSALCELHRQLQRFGARFGSSLDHASEGVRQVPLASLECLRRSFPWKID